MVAIDESIRRDLKIHVLMNKPIMNDNNLRFFEFYSEDSENKIPQRHIFIEISSILTFTHERWIF